MARKQQIKIGSEIEIAGVTYRIEKTGPWECVAVSESGEKRFPRTATVQRKLAEKAKQGDEVSAVPV
jgi:hypothetical protein